MPINFLFYERWMADTRRNLIVTHTHTEQRQITKVITISIGKRTWTSPVFSFQSRTAADNESEIMKNDRLIQVSARMSECVSVWARRRDDSRFVTCRIFCGGHSHALAFHVDIHMFSCCTRLKLLFVYLSTNQHDISMRTIRCDGAKRQKAKRRRRKRK